MPSNVYRQTRPKDKLMLWLLFLLIAAIVGVLLFNFWRKNSGEIDPWLKSGLPSVKVGQTQDFKQSKGRTFLILTEMMASGYYRLPELSLSQNRGNPFVAKTEAKP